MYYVDEQNKKSFYSKMKHFTLQNSPQYMTQAGFKPASMHAVNHLIIDFAISTNSSNIPPLSGRPEF